MLKRLTRHRIFQALLVLVVVAAALWAPLRHDYTTGDPVQGECGSACSTQLQTTDVYYGAPFSWLKLSKTVDLDHDERVISQTRQTNFEKMGFDLIFYLMSYAVTWAVRYTIKARRHAHFGN